MVIDRNQMLEILSEALDCVEKEVVGVTAQHAKRVAWLCLQMGKRAGVKDVELADIVVSALLHDNALNEYRQDYENGRLRFGATGKEHCIAGEKNLEYIFPDKTHMKSFVLYHHECADGSGPFGKRAEEVPLGAQMIHIADEVDLQFALGQMKYEQVDQVRRYVSEKTGELFSKQVAELFLKILTEETLEQCSDANVEKLVLDVMQIPMEANRGMAELFAQIIDYKSPFTKEHSLGVARKAECMARCYGYDETHTEWMYIAGALHDIGKLLVDTEVLEKPGRLNDAEYRHIQSHAYETYRLLSKIDGFEEIRDWAAFHHEKLNGKGYPFGKTVVEMSEEARILACLDIYQALTENRPYKSGMSHKKAMTILSELVEKGELDKSVVAKIDHEFDDEDTTDIAACIALFQCPVCGYVYEGEVVPIDYECPVCKQPPYAFYRIK